MDRIFVRELAIDTVIGIFEWERRIRQRVSVDLEMQADVAQAASGDHIDATLNYKAVAKRIVAYVERSRFQLVETLAERIAAIVLNEFQVPWVKVTVNKPGAVRDSKSVGVHIERRREPVTQCFIGIGSNIEPQRNVRAALDALERRYGPLRISPVYRNRPVGFEGEDFLNLVVAMHTQDDVHELVRALEQIERDCGRSRTEGSGRYEARTLDLDLLMYGDRVLAERRLKLPRDEIVNSAFVLRPLAELAGSERHPVTGRRFAALWAEFDQDAHPMTEVDLEVD